MRLLEIENVHFLDYKYSSTHETFDKSYEKKSMQFLWSLQSLLHCKSFYQDPLTGKTFTAAHLFKTFVLQLSIRSIFHFHKNKTSGWIIIFLIFKKNVYKFQV